MARGSRPPVTDTVADQVLDPPESTLLDLLDNLLNKGVMAHRGETQGLGADAMESRSRGCAEVGRSSRADDCRVPAAADGAPGDPADGAEDADEEGSRGSGRRSDDARADYPRHRRKIRPDA